METEKKKPRRRIVIERTPWEDSRRTEGSEKEPPPHLPVLEEIFDRDPWDEEIERVIGRHPWVGKNKDLAAEVLHFERFGRIEYLIRAVSKDYEFWCVSEVQTGDHFPSQYTPTSAGLGLVLDGDHVLSYDSELISLEKPCGHVIQQVQEMKDFIKDRNFGDGDNEYISRFVPFPTPSRFTYTYDTAASVFDVHGKVDKFVLFVLGNSKISVWKWVNEKGKEPKVEKEYFHEFKEEIRDVIALPKCIGVGTNDLIAVSLEHSVVVFDLTTRKELRKINVLPLSGFHALILPNGNLAVIQIAGPHTTVVDVSEVLKGGTQYSEVDLASPQAPGRYIFMYESFDEALIFPNQGEGSKATFRDPLLLLAADEGKNYKLYRENKEGKEVKVDGKTMKYGTMATPLNKWETDGFYHCLFHGWDLGIVQGSEFSFSSEEKERIKNPLPLHQAYPEYDVAIGGVMKSCRHNAPKGWSKAELVAEVVRQNLQTEKKAKGRTKDSLCFLLREEGKGNKPERKEEVPKGKTTLTFVDARDLMKGGEAKSKQTLELFRGMTGNGMHLPGNRYLVELYFGSYQLINFSTETGQYSLGPVLQFQTLLPASGGQKKIMSNFLDEFLVEGGAQVPREIADIISKFI